jgi:multisubunit Na+/H+ antiporter MnhB subunit
MTPSLALNLALALLLLGMAGWAVLVRSTQAAVIGFMVFGLLLTLAWARLDGLDVALTEAAIGGGLTGFLLLGAAVRLRSVEHRATLQAPGLATRILAALAAGSVTLLLAFAVLTLPSPAPSLAPAVAENIAMTQVGNPVTAVLLAFRALDTLLETLVLVLAMLGIWSLADDRVWGGRPGFAIAHDASGILHYAARILVPIGVVIGGYIFWIGADDPGGKFQGATLLAAMWLLLVLAGLRDAPRVSSQALRLWVVLGPLVFISVGLLGSWLAGSFLGYPQGYAKLMIVTVELALLPSLTLILGLLIMGAPKREIGR